MTASNSRRGWRGPVAWLIALSTIALAAAYFLLREFKPPAPPPPSAWSGPVAVRVEPVKHEDFTVRLQAIGTVTPLQSVTVRSRVPGQLARVLVREGERVQSGQLLAEIDPQPYRVRLAQAQGLLQQNRAQLQVAERELARYRRLFRQDAVARQQLERQEALVQQLRGRLASDQAQVDDARLQLSYTRIEAPLSGRVGLRRVDPGNLVAANDGNGLFTLLQTQPMAAVFSLPEAQVAAVRAAHARTPPPPIEAWDRAGRQLIARGYLDTLDNQIDLATGTLRMKARFENTDEALFPNQFVNLRLEVDTLAAALTIPSEALQYGSGGSYVYVVDADKALVRPVTIGPTDDSRAVIRQGLTAADKVVLEGLDRLEDGREVTVVDLASASPPAPAQAPAPPPAATPAAPPAATPAAPPTATPAAPPTATPAAPPAATPAAPPAATPAAPPAATPAAPPTATPAAPPTATPAAPPAKTPVPPPAAAAATTATQSPR